MAIRKAAKWRFPQSFLSHFMRDVRLERSSFERIHDSVVSDESLHNVINLSDLSSLRESALAERLERLKHRVIYLKFDRPVAFRVSTVALRKIPEIEAEVPVVGMPEVRELTDVSMFAIFKFRGTLGKVVNFMHHVEHRLPGKAISKDAQKGFAGEVKKRLGKYVHGIRGVFVPDPYQSGRFHFMIIDFRRRDSAKGDLKVFGHHDFRHAYEA